MPPPLLAVMVKNMDSSGSYTASETALISKVKVDCPAGRVAVHPVAVKVVKPLVTKSVVSVAVDCTVPVIVSAVLVSIADRVMLN